MKIFDFIKQKKLPLKPGDIILFILLICLSVFTIKKNHIKNSGTVTITANGVSYKYNLTTNGIYNFEGEIGTTTVEIRNGKIRIIDSPCPNKTCMALGFGTTIVCLPNKVFISVDTEDGDFDAVAE